METPGSQQAPAPPDAAAPPTIHRRSLKKNIIYAVTGVGFMNVCQFGVVVLITKLVTAEVLGQYRWALLWSAVWTTFLSLQLRAALINDTRNEFTFGTYCKLRTWGMLLSSAILAGLIIWRFGTEYTSLSVIAIFAGTCLGRVVITASEVYWAAFQRRERLDLVAKSTVLRGLVMIGAFAFFLPLFSWLTSPEVGWLPRKRLGHGTALACIAYAIGWAAVGYFYERRILRSWPELDWSFTWQQVWRLALRALPLGIIMVIITACEAVPGLILEREGNATLLGYFSALLYVMFPANLVVIQAGLAASNRLAQFAQTDISAYVRLLGKLVFIAIGFGVAIYASMWLFGRWLLNVLYKPEYAEHYDVFMIIVLSQCITLLASVVGVGTTQMRLFWSQVPLQLVILAATWLTAELTIPHDPLRGAAWTALVRAVVQTGLYVVFVLISIGFRRRFLDAQAAARPQAPDVGAT